MDKHTENLLKSDPDFFSKISKLRKVKSGGKAFKDPEVARRAQRKSAEARRRNAQNTN